jgi:hypothetical protein
VALDRFRRLRPHLEDGLNKHFGLPSDPHRRENTVPNLFEQTIVDHVIGALEPPEVDDQPSTP